MTAVCQTTSGLFGCRAAKNWAVALAVAAVCAVAAAQAPKQQIGGVSARAPHSTVKLGRNGSTEIDLTGGVSIQTDAGDTMTATHISLSMGRNPLTGKSDVRTATADGDVKFKRVQRVVPSKGAAYDRVINGSADHGVLNRFANEAVFTGSVDVSADDPNVTYVWKNAEKATINLITNVIDANAPSGQQVQMEMHSKGPAAK